MTSFPSFGSLSTSEYFSSPSAWRYLVGAVGWPSYTLPGVFSQNPIPEVVNGSLWSIPVELECYVALGVLLALGLVRYRVVMLAVAAMTLTLTAIPLAMEGTRGLHYHVSLFIGQFVYFITGSVLYLYRHQVPRHIFLFWSAVGIAGVLLMSGHFAVVLPIAVAYATVFLASSPLPPPPGLPGGDYSYGIYIYASPVQQAVLLVSPAVWWLNIVLALPLTIACAIASWIFIEKPALEMKSRRRRAAAESGGLPQPPSALRRPPLASEPAE